MWWTFKEIITSLLLNWTRNSYAEEIVMKLYNFSKKNSPCSNILKNSFEKKSNWILKKA